MKFNIMLLPAESGRSYIGVCVCVHPELDMKLGCVIVQENTKEPKNVDRSTLVMQLYFLS